MTRGKRVFTFALGGAIAVLSLFGRPQPSRAISPIDQYAGRILLQVDRHGEAWYVNPSSKRRAYLGRPSDALAVMRHYGLGITDHDLAQIPVAGSGPSGHFSIRHRLAGKILIQVQQHGQAWYVDPRSLQRYALGRPADAWRVMTELGQGVTTQQLSLVAVEKMLDVPFTSQAPYGLWDADHNNFCEEASALMVSRSVTGRKISGPADAEAVLQSLKQWELSNLGYHYDTDMAATATMMREVLNVNADVIERPSIANITQWLDQGMPVIVPVAGALLRNPRFHGVPPYHVFVIVGYTTDGWFIANDPGTSYGQAYRYRQSDVMHAMHDYNGGDVLNGARRIILTSSAL